MSKDTPLSEVDLIVLEAIVRGENRLLNDIAEATDRPYPLLRLTLVRLRQANLVRFIGDGRYRRHIPTPEAWTMFKDDAMRRAEDRFS